VNSQPTIAHSVHSYLSLTCNWIYTLLINLKKFKPIVIAESKWSPESFPFKDVYSWDDFSKINQLSQKIFKRLFFLPYYPFQYQVLKKNKARLLHSHFGDLGYKNLGLQRSLKLPHIISFYGYDLGLISKDKFLWAKRYERLFSEGDIFLVEGNYSKKRLTELGCPQEKIRIHHIGIDLNKIQFNPRKVGKEGIIKILIASSFLEKKGIPYALEAIGKIIKKYDNIKIILIGDSPKINPQGIEEKKKILETIDKFDLNQNTIFLGYQPYDVFLKEAQQTHIFLAPSIHSKDGDSEGGVPVSIIEMSASGMPIISTTHCDIPEVVIDGKNGFLVPERDSDALADRLEYLIEHQEIWESMGKFGRGYIEKNYNIKNQIAQLEKIYMELL